jgi:hypothetical protein
MKKIAALLIVVVILIMTNPNPERHQAAIRATVQQTHPFAGALVGLAQLFGDVTAYQSFGIISYTTHRGEVISVGLLGYVWVSSAVNR